MIEVPITVRCDFPGCRKETSGPAVYGAVTHEVYDDGRAHRVPYVTLKARDGHWSNGWLIPHVRSERETAPCLCPVHHEERRGEERYLESRGWVRSRSENYELDVWEPPGNVTTTRLQHHEAVSNQRSLDRQAGKS